MNADVLSAGAAVPPPRVIVGRNRELAIARAVLAGERHLLLEGPVGVGKTTVALAVCDGLGRATLRVDGDGGYSVSRLVGWFEPPLVLVRGYGEHSFSPGPLVAAMRSGGVLLVNDLDRMPEPVQNVLLPALDEGLVQVPGLGDVRAAQGFLVVATANPGERVATGGLSEALRDRFEHLALGYQSAGEEAAIVAADTGSANAALVRTAVRLTRATRVHPELHSGASVRGASATVAVAERLEGERVKAGTGREMLRRAVHTALTTRVEVRDGAVLDVAGVLDDVLAKVVDRGEDPDAVVAAAPPEGRDGGAEVRREAQGAPPVPASRSTTADAAPAYALDDRRSLADHLRLPVEELDGWWLAGALSAGEVSGAGARVEACAQRLAAGAVLQRATRLVGPLKGATHTIREPLREPYAGELDVEATVDNLLGKPYPEPGDWVVRRRVDRRHQVVLMVDTSLSMSGEKMALATVAATVLALKLHAGDLSVVLFAGEARTISRFGESVAPTEFVRRMLSSPCGGGTHIAAALERGHAELRRGRDPRRSGLLVSDCVYTVGPDPRAAAASFGALHVLLVDEPLSSGEGVWISPRRAVGEAVARASDGGVVRVSGFAALPRRMLEVADAVLR